MLPQLPSAALYFSHSFFCQRLDAPDTVSGDSKPQPREQRHMLDGIESLKVQSVVASQPATALRVSQGLIQSADDVIALRKVSGLTQKQFASAMGISVHTLRNWEQGRRSPEGP